MDKNCTVSVIIPAYNPGQALRKCLESVMKQTFKDIEIIVVNDGSTDSTDEICQELSSKDNRIVYISQENAGVSAARNRGIIQSRGEYICFVDSDDYVDADYVSCMVDGVMQSDADIVIQGLKQIKDGQVLSIEKFEQGTYSVSALTEHQFDNIFYYCGPYCKLFKTSTVKENSIEFPTNLSYGEDAVFYHTYLRYCRIIELLSDTSYNYKVTNAGALSTKRLPPDEFWANQSNRRGAYKQLKKIYDLPLVISRKEHQSKLIGVSGMLNSIFRLHENDITVARFIDMMIKDDHFELKELKATSMKSNIILMLIKSNKKLSRAMLKMLFR